MKRHKKNIEDQTRDTIEAASKKRLIFRATHRGIKEMDIVLGDFVVKNIAKFTPAQMIELEFILSLNDRDLYSYVIGEKELPEALRTPLFQRIIKNKL